MENITFDMLANQGGAILLAVIMVFVLKGYHENSIKRADERAIEQKQAHERELARIEQQAEGYKEDKNMLAEIVKQNTEASVRLLTVVERVEKFVTEHWGKSDG